MTHCSDTLAVFDTETTGLDTRYARIVTCFLGDNWPGRRGAGVTQLVGRPRGGDP